MWRDYSSSYIKNNRSSSVSIMASAFIATFFLSLLCSLFYNMWVYDVETIVLEDGDWQGRINVQIGEYEIGLINNFANVEKAVVNKEASDVSKGNISTVDIYFINPRTIYNDMGLIRERLGLEEKQITYNYQLLSMYFIRIPDDTALRWVFPFYFAVLVIVCISLIMVIHNSFAVSMDARIHQLGILSSIGATPKQLRTCLIQEAAALSVLPVALGSFFGIAATYGAVNMMDRLAGQMAGRHDSNFSYHPFILVMTIVISFLTVMISAWIPAYKLSKLTPLEAIRGNNEAVLKKKKHSYIPALLFGIEGELAGNALKAQKKSLRTSAVSLTLSFFGFTAMLCFFQLSELSTDETYFARYQDVWDVMADVKNASIEEFDLISQLKEAESTLGAESCVVYQKATATSKIPASDISDELNALGGPKILAGESGEVGYEDENSLYLVETPIIIMDDESFMEYCRQVGINAGLDGTVVINHIWNSIDSNFRYPEYVPYLKENFNSISLYKESEESDIELKILGYTGITPDLREEYDDYALVHICPLSLWKSKSGQLGNMELPADVEPDIYIRILSKRKEGVTLEKLNSMEKTAAEIISPKYEVETENRIQEKLSNDKIIWGYKMIIGSLCILLAIIGIAGIFSYTMGFLRQRSQEFARYASVGMTPAELKKMFCIEILIIAGRPVLITLLLTALLMKVMISVSYLEPAKFWATAPVMPVVIFMAAIFGFVTLAYHIGVRRSGS